MNKKNREVMSDLHAFSHIKRIEIRDVSITRIIAHIAFIHFCSIYTKRGFSFGKLLPGVIKFASTKKESINEVEPRSRWDHN